MPEAAELEQRLDSIRQAIDWPPTPAIANRIRARIATPAPAARPWFQSRWALAAVVALVALAALLAYSPSREAIASWINLHTTFSRQSVIPTPSPAPPGPLGKRLGLGSQTTLTEAQSKVKWHIVLPPSLGQPDEVYLQLPPAGPPEGEVTLVYSARPGFKTSGTTGVAVLITEVKGQADSLFFGKIIGNGTTMEQVSVNGHTGYWISGKPHDFFFIDADGNTRDETLRLATNTLLIDDSGIVVRIEGDMTKAQALELAASLT
jgi:hypothetical protein